MARLSATPAERVDADLWGRHSNVAGQPAEEEREARGRRILELQKEEKRKTAADDWLLRTGFGNHVYWMYAADDTLLYIGMTGHLRDRLKSHYLTQPWIDEVARIDAEDEYLDKAAAYHAEQKAIRRWRPKYNKTGHGSGKE
jgi:predicted GIY-YIG superfamily endonuclease